MVIFIFSILLNIFSMSFVRDKFDQRPFSVFEIAYLLYLALVTSFLRKPLLRLESDVSHGWNFFVTLCSFRHLEPNGGTLRVFLFYNFLWRLYHVVCFFCRDHFPKERFSRRNESTRRFFHKKGRSIICLLFAVSESTLRFCILGVTKFDGDGFSYKLFLVGWGSL